MNQLNLANGGCIPDLQDLVNKWYTEPREYLPAWNFSAELCREHHLDRPPCFFPSDFSNRPGTRVISSIPNLVTSCPAVKFYHDYRNLAASHTNRIWTTQENEWESEKDLICSSDNVTSVNLNSYTPLQANWLSGSSFDFSSKETTVSPIYEDASKFSQMPIIQTKSEIAKDQVGTLETKFEIAQDETETQETKSERILEEAETKELNTSFLDLHTPNTPTPQARISYSPQRSAQGSAKKLKSVIDLSPGHRSPGKSKVGNLKNMFRVLINKKEIQNEELPEANGSQKSSDIECSGAIKICARAWSDMEIGFVERCISELSELIDTVSEQINNSARKTKYGFGHAGTSNSAQKTEYDFKDDELTYNEWRL